MLALEMKILMLKNFLIALVGVMAGMAVGCLVGFFLNYNMNNEACQYLWGIGNRSVNTEKLNPYYSLRNLSVFLGAIFGFVVSQVTIVLESLKGSKAG